MLKITWNQIVHIPINISKIPEIIDHIKSEHFICFFIFFPIVMPRFRKINWKRLMNIGNIMYVVPIKLELIPIPKQSNDSANPKKIDSCGTNK